MAEGKIGEAMGRGDFFRWGLKSIKEKTIETALSSINKFDSLASLAEEKWEKVGLLAQLTERPKSIFIKGRSYYLVLKDDGIRAYLAVCPHDNKPLQWQEHLQTFTCIHCKASFNREGEGSDPPGKMQECKVKCEEGIIYLSRD